MSDQAVHVRVLDQRPPPSQGQASCNRDGKALVANSAKARENVASLGTSPARCQPHSRRNVLSTDSISINSRVVGKLNTAFRDKGSCQC